MLHLIYREENNFSRKQPAHLHGTIIIKLKSDVPNSREALYFGIPELDQVLANYEFFDRRALFPLAPFNNNALFKVVEADSHGFNRVYVLSVAPDTDIYNAIEQLLATGVLEYAEPYVIFNLDFTPNDSRFNQQYSLECDQHRGSMGCDAGRLHNGNCYLR